MRGSIVFQIAGSNLPRCFIGFHLLPHVPHDSVSSLTQAQPMQLGTPGDPVHARPRTTPPLRQFLRRHVRRDLLRDAVTHRPRSPARARCGCDAPDTPCQSRDRPNAHTHARSEQPGLRAASASRDVRRMTQDTRRRAPRTSRRPRHWCRWFSEPRWSRSGSCQLPERRATGYFRKSLMSIHNQAAFLRPSA